MPKTFFSSSVISPVVVTPPETVILEMDGYTAEVLYDILFDLVLRLPENSMATEPGEALQFVVNHFKRPTRSFPAVDLVGDNFSLRVR